MITPRQETFYVYLVVCTYPVYYYDVELHYYT